MVRILFFFFFSFSSFLINFQFPFSPRHHQISLCPPHQSSPGSSTSPSLINPLRRFCLQLPLPRPRHPPKVLPNHQLPLLLLWLLPLLLPNRSSNLLCPPPPPQKKKVAPEPPPTRPNPEREGCPRRHPHRPEGHLSQYDPLYPPLPSTTRNTTCSLTPSLSYHLFLFVFPLLRSREADQVSYVRQDLR